MLYANIAVFSKISKIDQLFTYSVKETDKILIKPGQIVEITFGVRKAFGIVFSLTNNEKMVDHKKIKEIIKIHNSNPILSQRQIELVNWLSNYYYTSIGKATRQLLPPIAKRIISKTQLDNAQFKKNIINAKNYIIYERFLNRIDAYVKIVKKILTSSKQAIVLFPSINELTIAQNIFSREFDNHLITIWNTTLNNTLRWNNWSDVSNNKTKIVLGTRSTIFAPCHNLGLIILDDIDNFGYKEDQSPKYQVLRVAKTISQLNNCDLLFGSNIPSAEDLYYLKKAKYKKIKNDYFDKLKKIEIQIINSNDDKGLISWHLEELISSTLNNKKKILLIVNRKGIGSVYSCEDCGYTYVCPNCDLNLIPRSINKQIVLSCRKCTYKLDAPSQCDKCLGVKLSAHGIGIQKVENILKKLFPQNNIITFEKNSSSLLDSINKSGTDITIATNKILEYPNLDFDIVCLINPDTDLNFPDYKAPEIFLQTIVKLINITNNKLVLQTFNPENRLIKNLVNKQFNKITEEELDRREQAQLPPFSRLIKLTYTHMNEKKSEVKINQMAKILKGIKGMEILGPIPCYIPRQGNKYYSQIIIKIIDQSIQNRQVLDAVKFSKGWIIDVDPISLI